MDLRRAPRVDLELELTLMRPHGGPVLGRTQDVGPGGARVIVERPLAIDEELTFDLVTREGHVDGRARVVRQDGVNSYALRFTALAAPASVVLTGELARTT
jgi:hypothetical protein